MSTGPPVVTSPSFEAWRNSLFHPGGAPSAMSARRHRPTTTAHHAHTHPHLASDPAVKKTPSSSLSPPAHAPHGLAASIPASASSAPALPPPLSSSNSATVRKAQNRMAQREFRQRKQEYIRALECRVELLSADHPTQIGRLRWLLRQLMLENAMLRVVLGAAGAHISTDGVGGFLGSHPDVRRELEHFVFNLAERRSLKAWDPQSDDKAGHTVLTALRAHSQLPPQASLAPVQGEPQRLPVLPDLRRLPPKRPRKRLSSDKKQSSTLMSGKAKNGSRENATSVSPSALASPPLEDILPRSEH